MCKHLSDKRSSGVLVFNDLFFTFYIPQYLLRLFSTKRPMAPPIESRASQKPLSTCPPAASTGREKNLTARLINVAEEERKHLARELHDDIGQRLSLLAVTLDILKNDPRAEESLRVKLEDALRELKDLAEDIHNLSHRLHSSKLQHLGLPAALKEVCRQMANQHHLNIQLQLGKIPSSMPEAVALCFYRVAQEALNNAVEHSHSKRVDVQLDDGDGRVRLRVRDFGIGFDPSTSMGGLGLATMEERLRMIGGTLSIKSLPRSGTELTAEAPPQVSGKPTTSANLNASKLTPEQTARDPRQNIRPSRSNRQHWNCKTHIG